MTHISLFYYNKGKKLQILKCQLQSLIIALIKALNVKKSCRKVSVKGQSKEIWGGMKNDLPFKLKS